MVCLEALARCKQLLSQMSLPVQGWRNLKNWATRKWKQVSFVDTTSLYKMLLFLRLRSISAAQKASVKGSKTRSLASCVVHDLAAVCSSSSTIIGLHM